MKQERFLNCQEATSLHTHPLRYNTLPLTSPTELEMVLELSAPLAYLCLSVEQEQEKEKRVEWRREYLSARCCLLTPAPGWEQGSDMQTEDQESKSNPLSKGKESEH